MDGTVGRTMHGLLEMGTVRVASGTVRVGFAQVSAFPMVGCPSTRLGMLRYHGTFGGKSTRPDFFSETRQVLSMGPAWSLALPLFSPA